MLFACQTVKLTVLLVQCHLLHLCIRFRTSISTLSAPSVLRLYHTKRVLVIKKNQFTNVAFKIYEFILSLIILYFYTDTSD